MRVTQALRFAIILYQNLSEIEQALKQLPKSLQAISFLDLIRNGTETEEMAELLDFILTRSDAGILKKLYEQCCPCLMQRD